MQLSPRPLENAILGIGFALLGTLLLVIITAGRRRDYPLLSAIYDLAAGVIVGAVASWLVLSTRPDVEGTWFVWTGVCAVLVGGLNLWRRSARGGKLVLFLSEIATRAKRSSSGLVDAGRRPDTVVHVA